MPPADPWLKRQNAALKLRGHGVSIDVAGSKIRLRATLPPKPDAPADTPAHQQRISTGLSYPDQAAEGVRLAEALGNALERHRVGLEPFDWAPWLNRRRLISGRAEGISGEDALKRTMEWWFSQRRRSSSSDHTWLCCYEAYLRPLRGLPTVTPGHLETLVKGITPGTRSRKMAGIATVAMAQALGWPQDLIARLRESAKGYSLADVKRREILSDEAMEAMVDGLPDHWQWPVGIMATYGCRPHEALLFAEVLPSGLLSVGGGKTGARQSLPLPHRWVERWRLGERRMPPIDLTRGHAKVGKSMATMFRYRKLPCMPYDLRHAWAIRAIRDPRISPSLAAKSMGHTLTMHSAVYQRWFDSSEMESAYALIAAS